VARELAGAARATGPAAESAAAPILRAERLAVRFGPVRAVDGVDLEIRPGELVALAGENGAGKTTLVRCIAGDIAQDEGEIYFAGRRARPGSADTARRGLAVVWQDLALCDNLDVAANLFLGQERSRIFLSEARAHRDAAALLRRFGITVGDTACPVRYLSGGQRQLLAVARAMRDQPRLLILDEPTAALGVTESARVEELITQLHRQGTAILLVSHDVEQMYRLASRIVVLRRGRVAGDLAPGDTYPDEVVALISGQQPGDSARGQLVRLRSLVGRLASAKPSTSLDLIVSALAPALGASQICIHLIDADALVCVASTGLPPAVASAWSSLPLGQAGGPAGLAASRAVPVIDDDVSAGAAWAPLRATAAAAGVRSVWAVPVAGSGGVAGVITVLRGVTGRPRRDQLDLLDLYAGYVAGTVEREAAELAHQEAAALRRSQELQRRFLSMLSHELRTPLTGIRGYASSLLQPDVTWDTGSQQRFLTRIAAESARLGRLVDGLLDYSAIESGILRLHPDWCDVPLVLEAAVSCLPPASAAAVQISCAGDLPPVWADHDRLEQVFVNLLDNAFRHNPPGTRVRLEASAATGTGSPAVVVRVCDNGSGVPLEKLTRLFDPAVPPQVRGGGTGLGLSISRGIVEAHRGRIDAEKRERGACFRVWLPADGPGIPADDLPELGGDPYVTGSSGPGGATRPGQAGGPGEPGGPGEQGPARDRGDDRHG
jgi:signal transduction histidine kinase/ABC-type multidrug transport system ATPase subunit